MTTEDAVTEETVVSGRLAEWLTTTFEDPGPFEMTRLSGGNSNETFAVTSPAARRVLRRPPVAALDPSAHDVAREHQLLVALEGTSVPTARPLALCVDEAIVGAPFFLMEAIDGLAFTTDLAPGYDDEDAALAEFGADLVRTLASLHAVDWRAVGLEGFGRPEGFLDRQVDRWSTQLEHYRVRDLPYHEELGEWLRAEMPRNSEAAIMHGDFHADNTLASPERPARVLAVIDWEMTTIGDPLVDLGVLLAFWGEERPAEPAMPQVQEFSRRPGAPTREQLASLYSRLSGRSVERLPWYMALGFWKLATIVESAYAQYLDGRLPTPYARRLETDVPALLREAAGFAGIA